MIPKYRFTFDHADHDMMQSPGASNLAFRGMGLLLSKSSAPVKYMFSTTHYVPQIHTVFPLCSQRNHRNYVPCPTTLLRRISSDLMFSFKISFSAIEIPPLHLEPFIIDVRIDSE